MELAKLPPPTPPSAAISSSTQNGVSAFCTAKPSSVAGMSSRPADTIVQLRPPNVATANVYGKRRVAPTRLGSEISQKDSVVVSAKPAAGSITTTMLHSCQTMKPRNSAKIDQRRLRRAIARPCEAQKAASSGFQPSIHRPGRRVGDVGGVAVSGVVLVGAVLRVVAMELLGRAAQRMLPRP